MMRIAAGIALLWGGLDCIQHVCGFVTNAPVRTGLQQRGAGGRSTSAVSMKAGSNPKVIYLGGPCTLFEAFMLGRVSPIRVVINMLGIAIGRKS